MMIAVATAPALAFADAAKPAPSPPRKLGSEARLFVIEKDAPSLDKTVKLARASLPVTPATKDK